MRLDNGPRAILDQSEGIPGISHFDAGDLVSELYVHPYGDYLLSLNYTTGVVSLTADHRRLRPDISFDLGLGRSPIRRSGLAVTKRSRQTAGAHYFM